jgi:hypothetical protein
MKKRADIWTWVQLVGGIALMAYGVWLYLRT